MYIECKEDTKITALKSKMENNNKTEMKESLILFGETNRLINAWQDSSEKKDLEILHQSSILEVQKVDILIYPKKFFIETKNIVCISSLKLL